MFHKNELLLVSKPSRYLGKEINSFNKTDYKVHFCLVFPDVYEVGMSHYGLKLLYENLNSQKDIFCERFFMPWIDAISTFNKDIFISLESKTPLSNFDILGFSLQYELSYTNMLFILNKSEIPIKSAERTDQHPLIIAGGPCTVNPAPVKDYIDVFFIGEMDEKLSEILNSYKNKSFKNRLEKLKFFDSFEFTYVPSLNPDKKIKRFIYNKFSEEGFIKAPLVPNFSVVHDRISLEISRGCTRGCRFCQAGFIYRPSRERDVKSLINNALVQLENSGYFEISFLSLSAADYTKLEELLDKLNSIVYDKNVSVSLPSVRADQIKSFIFRELSKVRKSGFTIAPEAGSQRLRNIINKNLTEEEIIEAVKLAKEGGFNHAKLYFMIGLPFEEISDVIAIADLAYKIKKIVGKRFDISVSVSNFVPKPHTPFQWCGQDNYKNLEYKQNLLKEEFRKRRIKLKLHDIGQSILEACFSRGGDELNKILYDALSENIIFDGWSEFFNFKKWEQIFNKNGLNIYEYASQLFDLEDNLPWDHIDTGISKDFLIKEYRKSSNGLVVNDCKTDKCYNCGVCDFKNIKNIFAKDYEQKSKDIKIDNNKFNKYLITFEKVNDSIFFSALDTSRYFQHIFLKNGVNLKFTQGFNPQPKINYIYPLPLGIKGLNELMIIESDSTVLDLKGYMDEIGFKIKNIEMLENKIFDICVQEFIFDNDSFAFIKNLWDIDKLYYKKVTKKGKEKIVNLKDFLVKMDNNFISVKISPTGSFNFLDFFRFWDYNISKLELLRINIYPIK
nr:TIGR03960 family B12-binding radical SAM protein [Deferribacter desulfuricans]